MRLNKQISVTLVSFGLALPAGALGAAGSAQAASPSRATQAGPNAVTSELRLLPGSHGLGPGRVPSPPSRCAARRRGPLGRRLLRRRAIRRGCQTHGLPGRAPRRLPVSPTTPAPAPTPAPVAAPATTLQICAGADLMPNPGNLDQVRSATLCLINNQRVQAGLHPLSVDATLQSVAQGKSGEMVARDYFDHTNPDGLTASARVLNSGYVPDGASYAIGENLAFGTMGLATPAKIVDAWMNSPGHRENILDPAYGQTGIGVAPAAPPSFSEGQPGGTYTEEFGSHS